MATIRCGSIAEFNKRIREDMRARQKRIKKAVRNTAQVGKKVVRENVPVAFHELERSIQSDSHRIFTEAPHAASVENGSRPHRPPLQPLIDWVRLRGMQGLKSDKQLARLKGSTTRRHARQVASQIREYMLTDGSDAIAANAPEQIARAIQNAIAKNGTKPHHYMGDSVPDVVNILDAYIKGAMPDRE
jgi:ribosomal protein L22